MARGSTVSTFGTAAWKRKSVIGREVELVAVRVMAVTTGLLGLRSNENTIFRPFFSYAVMLGIPPTQYIEREREIHVHMNEVEQDIFTHGKVNLLFIMTLSL